MGVPVSCDCNYRSKLWGVEEAGRVLADLMPFVDCFIGGREDAEKLFGIGAGGSESNAAAQLRDRFGFKWVAMTLRHGVSASVSHLAGLLCAHAGCFTSREYEMQIVDRVGGGDAFTSGLVYGLLTGFELQRVIEFATAASCLKHSVPGDFNLVSVEEVEQLIAGDASGRVQR
jgi:2-dehydro-3-deoxygluconokinase